MRKANLHVKLSKYAFDAKEIDFFGYKVGQFGIDMVPSKLDLIAIWPVSITYREMQVFLGFANFYCCFILNYSRVAVGLTNLLSGNTNGKFKKIRFEMTQDAIDSFNELKRLFFCASMLLHYNFTCRILLEYDALRCVVEAILSQLVDETSQWHPIAF